MATTPNYVELHAISNFTFLRGASHPEELVTRAYKLGYRALALTDECSLAGVVRAHIAARDHSLHLIIGAEFSLVDGPRLVLLATNRRGYGNLSELITRSRRAADKGTYHLTRADLVNGVPECLTLLIPGLQPDAEAVWWARHTFPDRTWLALELLCGPDDTARLKQLQQLSKDTGVPLTAAGDVHMHIRSRRALQDTLTAIRLGTTVNKAGHHLYPNGERHLRNLDELAGLYPAELLAETVRIAERCRFSLDELRYEYPKELVPPGETPKSHLRKLTKAGMQKRWPQGTTKKVRQQVEHELQLIAELQYEPYFLTVHDIVSFAKNQNILCQGRGSAANSAVCYCLGITEVDPARMEILFERFISKERNEPPDIDVDFEHERREEVIQHVYNKYGRDRAALAATVITYRPRSAVRDVGKALGLSLSQVDRVAKSLAWWDGKRIIPERLREVGFDPANQVIKRLAYLVNTLVGFPRHLSQHVGGFVISQDALSRLVPIENAAKPQPRHPWRTALASIPSAMAERTVIQWDKDDLDALGLLKVDVLGLGMLSAIHRAFDLVKNYRGAEFTLSTAPAEDPAVYTMIQHADTIGVFQIESRAQMSMLPRLKPKTFYDLVIEVAIVRPGPIQGNMVHPYLRRRQGREPVTYPSPIVREVLERTLGVPIFQEQVIKLAMVAAGFSAGEADRLRRAMAAWRRKGGLEPFEKRLIEGMRERGYSKDFAQRIFQQIQGFGEYGFPESHAASFALLVYVSAWLKYYEPAAFTCALLNSQPMGFYAPAQLIQDVRRHGVEVRAVNVGASSWDCTLENSTSSPYGGKPGGVALRLGLRMVKGLSQAGADRLVAARAYKSFANIEDLARRAKLSRHDLDVLAAAGALVSLAGNRHQAYWQILGAEDPLPILEDASIPEGLPMLRQPTVADNTVADYKHLGFTLGQHPLGLLRSRLNRLQILTAAELKALPHGYAAHTAGLVITRQRPGTATGVIFLTLEDETGHFNVVVWGRLVEKQRQEVLGARLLGVVGEIQREGEVLHIIAKQLQDHSALLGQLTTHSRDFH